MDEEEIDEMLDELFISYERGELSYMRRKIDEYLQASDDENMIEDRRTM